VKTYDEIERSTRPAHEAVVSDDLRNELWMTRERLARQRVELRQLNRAQGALRVEHRELHRGALALEGKLASALLALEAGNYDEARAVLVQARGELARAVSDREGEIAQHTGP
jgi:hypothetical protein